MKEIKRWNHTIIHDTSDDVESAMVVNSHGRFVKHDDHAAIVAALQEQVRALAAENAALTSGFSFFMNSADAGFETYKSREEAVNAAEEMIADYRADASSEGWPEDAGSTCWGLIIQQATEVDYEKPAEENSWQGWCDYKLLPEYPATDAVIRELQAHELDCAADELMLADTVASTGVVAHLLRQCAARLRNGEVINA
ncbi:hypothetical protein [Erwinia sp. JH02]|uniref:hypothetical protein n=1 Tax=Erwinia sp. JH02 TaxID=2733394 RepID=UPI0014877E28|nr:hypothetical protein [Erwinia sp. JH02]NNS07287.1 hypothetical protein [Erwinia sp. JH02]